MSAAVSKVSLHNVLGYGLLALHSVLSALFAPRGWTYERGLSFGILYLLVLWFVSGIYVSLVVHMGIAHRALVFRPWFSQGVTLLQNTIGVYVDPTKWVMRHRRHHARSDHEGDPSKLPGDGFWKTLAMAVFPYRCDASVPRDHILATWPFRLVSNRYWAVCSQFSSYAVLWLLVREWRYALALWLSLRLIALWGYMIINYWCHDRRFGQRRYNDDNDTTNLGGWLAVTATFSGSLHNNHHHVPQFLRLSHDPTEYDFGLLALRLMKKLGLVRPSATGARLPADALVREAGL